MPTRAPDPVPRPASLWRSIAACAMASGCTIFATFASFTVFAFVWRGAAAEGSASAIHGLLWLNELTTAFIGLASGHFAVKFEPTLPFPAAIATAAVVEALHASASGAFAGDPAWRTAITMAAAAAIACIAAWLETRLQRTSARGS